MENIEEVLLELNSFEKATPAPEKLPPLLEQYLISVAKTGDTYFPWSKIKPVFRVKIDNVIEEFSSSSPASDVPPVPNVDPFSFPDCKEKVFQQLDCFAGVPFTVQRLCELLTLPKKHYKRTDKFMRALEKTMLVVSTVEPVRTDADVEHRLSTENGEEATGTELMNGDHRASDEENGDEEKDFAADKNPDQRQRGEKEKTFASTSCVNSVGHGNCSNAVSDNDVPMDAASAAPEAEKAFGEAEPEQSKEDTEAGALSADSTAPKESSALDAIESSASTDPQSSASPASSSEEEQASSVGEGKASESASEVPTANATTGDEDETSPEGADPNTSAEQVEADADAAEGEAPHKKRKLDDLEQVDESGLLDAPEN